MKLTIKKGKNKKDYLTCIRTDGTETSGWNPKIGIIPHDAIHFIIERYLALPESFFTKINKGAALDFMDDTNRAMEANANYHSESLVECFQASLAAGEFIMEDFLYLYSVTCQARDLTPETYSENDLFEIWKDLEQNNVSWTAKTMGDEMELFWS